MTIRYTKHALKKFSDFKKVGILIKKQDIRKVLLDPMHVEVANVYNEKIASGFFLDDSHILRVVHRVNDDIIIVITFYPTRKRRYIP